MTKIELNKLHFHPEIVYHGTAKKKGSREKRSCGSRGFCDDRRPDRGAPRAIEATDLSRPNTTSHSP